MLLPCGNLFLRFLDFIQDTVHFNQYGYELIGYLIYDRMDELGYFEEVKAAIWNDQEAVA